MMPCSISVNDSSNSVNNFQAHLLQHQQRRELPKKAPSDATTSASQLPSTPQFLPHNGMSMSLSLSTNNCTSPVQHALMPQQQCISQQEQQQLVPRHAMVSTGDSPMNRDAFLEHDVSQLDFCTLSPYNLPLSVSAAPPATQHSYAVHQPTSVPPIKQPPQRPAQPLQHNGEVVKRVPSNETISQRNVYISGLPSNMQSSEFRELCQRFGCVEASKLCVEGPSNPTKGYGFVLYYSEESAAACIKGLSGSYLNGRYLRARFANTSATPKEVKRSLLPTVMHCTVDGNGNAHNNSSSDANNASRNTPFHSNSTSPMTANLLPNVAAATASPSQVPVTIVRPTASFFMSADGGASQSMSDPHPSQMYLSYPMPPQQPAPQPTIVYATPSTFVPMGHSYVSANPAGPTFTTLSGVPMPQQSIAMLSPLMLAPNMPQSVQYFPVLPPAVQYSQ